MSRALAKSVDAASVQHPSRRPPGTAAHAPAPAARRGESRPRLSAASTCAARIRGGAARAGLKAGWHVACAGLPAAPPAAPTCGAFFYALATFFFFAQLHSHGSLLPTYVSSLEL